jgi:hypothetical protein
VADTNKGFMAINKEAKKKKGLKRDIGITGAKGVV